MVCTIDIGDANDIHPKNKQEVGRRLYLAAKVKAYGSSGIYSGLIFKTARLDGSSVRIAFDFAGNGLKTTENKPVKGFALADESGKWVWADAKIVCNDIVVETGHALSLPVVSVQYAWQSNPDCNLYNTEGLPAVPFKVNLKH